MRSREMFSSESERSESFEWPEPAFDIDDDAFAEAIAAGRTEPHAA